jgi:dihydrofolate reductase
MTLAIIAAIAKNRVIGANGKLPWHISDDLRRFKRLTTGHTVLMGRRTYESIGKPLVNRRNVVVTSQMIDGVECYTSIELALEALRDQEMVFVVGGARLYRELLRRADFLYLTLVDREVKGDAFFPEYEQLVLSTFKEVGREEHDGYVFVDFARKGRL